MFNNLTKKPTAHLNRRFVKDFLLPVPVSEPEYIEYYIDLLDDVYDSKRKYAVFLDLFARLGCDDEKFFVYGADIQNRALDVVKDSPAYKKFIGDTSDLFSGYKWLTTNVPKGQVYRGVNDGRRFLSIDLVKANYQALWYYTRVMNEQSPSDDDLILGTDTFDGFIRKFTDEDYYAEAKKFRQVIFGNANPKRQQKIQRYIIDNILSFLLNEGFFAEKDLKDYTSDEIVFAIDDNTPVQPIFDALHEKEREWRIRLHLDTYTLRWLKKEGEDVNSKADKIFVREFDDGRVDFKNVEASLVPQAYKHYKGITDITEKDLMFYNSNGLLARYMKPLKWA